MCTDLPTGSGSRPFERGLAEITAGRRTLLAGSAGVAVSVLAGAATDGALAAAPSAKPRRTKKRVYVLVTDGTLPEEISSGITPHLRSLRNEGLHFPRAKSMPVMETIPNHVMMMTGVRPDRSGVPANSIYDRKAGAVRTLDQASDLKADTVIERLNRNGLRTATVLSKEYLYGVFGSRATHRWEPGPIIPVSGHAPDVFTMRAATAMVQDHDPHLMFVNLGDIDRFGHSDLTGSTVKTLRRTALRDTDRLVGQFVDLLKSEGHWDNAMMIVLADHSMDWSNPNKVVSLRAPLDADPLLAGKVEIASNGGADLLYWTGPARQREQAIKRMMAISNDVRGVLSVYERTRPWLRLGPEAGDVVAFCKAGWRFSDPNPVSSNPIPGNHGHPATRPIPFFVTGGHPSLPKGKASQLKAKTIDVAPTVATFFGLTGTPRGGYDGHARI